MCPWKPCDDFCKHHHSSHFHYNFQKYLDHLDVSTTTSQSSSTSSAPTSGGSGTPSTGTGTWAAAYTKAKAALAKLNNNDKVKIVTGVGWENGPCVGNTGAVSSIGYPSLCLQDGPLR
jgi:hypothetical protein